MGVKKCFARSLFAAGLLLLASTGVWAADIESSGVLTNDTRTFAGREFYDAFVIAWQGLDTEGRYSLVVNEKPAARTGALMTVLYDGQSVYQRFISFNGRIARAAAADASQRIFNFVASGELERQFGGSELSGDGFH